MITYVTNELTLSLSPAMGLLLLKVGWHHAGVSLWGKLLISDYYIL